MGKRRRPVTSLAKFVRMLGDLASQEKQDSEKEEKFFEPVDVPLTGAWVEEDVPRKRSKMSRPLADEDNYNASDLVPNYSLIEEVPTHLQKCEYRLLLCLFANVCQRRLCPKIPILLAL